MDKDSSFSFKQRFELYGVIGSAILGTVLLLNTLSGGLFRQNWAETAYVDRKVTAVEEKLDGHAKLSFVTDRLTTIESTVDDKADQAYVDEKTQAILDKWDTANGLDRELFTLLRILLDRPYTSDQVYISSSIGFRARRGHMSYIEAPMALGECRAIKERGGETFLLDWEISNQRRIDYRVTINDAYRGDVNAGSFRMICFRTIG